MCPRPRELAALAVYSPSEAVRRAATEALQGRELRDCVGFLVSPIYEPIV
jgi:hypothetical protein